MLCLVDSDNKPIDLQQRISIDGVKDNYLQLVSKSVSMASTDMILCKDADDTARFNNIIAIMIRNEFFRVHRNMKVGQLLDYLCKVDTTRKCDF